MVISPCFGQTSSVKVAGEVRAFNDAFGESLALPDVSETMDDDDRRAVASSPRNGKQGGELFAEDGEDTFVVVGDSYHEMVINAMKTRDHPLLLEADKGAL